MPSIDINDLDTIGVIRDTPPYMLQPEAWSLGENMRVLNGGMARLLGWQSIFGTPSVAPYFAMYVPTASQPWWLYTSLAKAYAYDGTTHSDITRAAGGDYAAAGAKSWNGVLLGGVPILNNGVDVPQFWSAANGATKLAALTNWTSTLRARVLRAFGPIVCAYNCTESGTVYPHRVRWSHPADPGSVPSSWDETDTTKDAGETELSDAGAGMILDALGLSGEIFIYKEASVWRQRFIGGRFIFDFKPFMETAGLLTTRCVTLTPDGKKHFFISNDDIIFHDGNQTVPIGDKRFKRYLFNQIDVTNYANSFVFANPLYNETWFCYPQSGSTNPDRALIVHASGAMTEADVDFQATAIGTIQSSDTDTWTTTTGTWDTDTNPWSNSDRRRVVLCKPSATKLLELDKGALKDGSTFTGTLQRTALAVIGQKRNGEWISDFQVRKLIQRLWPKVQGGPINVRVGFQDVVEGPITWTATQAFDPSTSVYVDGVLGSARAVAVEFSGAVDWRIDGYKIDLELTGIF